jgi:hypothetical protein
LESGLPAPGVARGQDEHRKTGPLLTAVFEYLEAGQLRQAEIENGEIVGRCAPKKQGVITVVDFELLAQPSGQLHVIFHQEQAQLRGCEKTFFSVSAASFPRNSPARGRQNRSRHTGPCR